ncbi:MAG: SAM-dependent methyltransferase [Clostridiales bacterium]|nr:SAM-dependent methyltransferase [Clostridiales bacterium]
MKLPKLFEDRMRTLLGEEYEDFQECFSKPHYTGLRANILKIAPKEFEKICPFPINRIPWVRNGYYYDSKDQPAKHPYYYAGLYYIQEPSAMTPASLLPIEKGDKVLDICAAPGGKSTELGAKLGREGILVSNDISNSRAKALLKNIELFGIPNALVLSETPSKLAEYFPEYFDKILIDAPCSGEGMFRKSPSIMQNWEQYGVDYYNKLQKEIILFAARMLKPGGIMLYSTCTFSPEEDEGTIEFLLEQYPQFQVIKGIPDQEACKRQELSFDGFDSGKPEWINGRKELVHSIRLWPHKIMGEGHFIALLKKNPSEDKVAQDTISRMNFKARKQKSDPRKNLDKHHTNLSDEANIFLKEIKGLLEDGLLTVRDNRVYRLPKGLPDLTGLRILRQGLLLGEMKKQRFEPSQALANALTPEQYEKCICLTVDDPRVIRYLKCETIDLDGDYEDGWYLVCVEHYPLGWGKITKNKFKNKYLPGWRWV